MLRTTRRRTCTPYFKKVLVANRGEIACRVFQTCKRLGIPTVAVYSTADAKSKHVMMADEAICVGPPASAQSYLQMERIIDACKQTGADGVHPGYGFLSENAQFSKMLADNGITFIGPAERAIHAMGDKIESKKFAQDAGVNIIPGHDGEVHSEEELLAAAEEIGYPIMMKASAGGGGKGMRIATDPEDARTGFRLAKEEAMASFGDDRMLVEKFIVKPRHIEIQIIADKNGNTVYLPERECSIQRRNQKVIEEAPSTFVTEEMRKLMGEQAVQLARAVDYHTAGTVEMMVDAERNFYFLEMNTRLQVEHPITEEITGLDLVEEMMRAASGRDLSVKQADVKINGWATECRVYAEDPLKNYLPSIGRLTGYAEPSHVAGVRVDSGILEGSDISVYYDPLISKLTTWGESREQSVERMTQALDDYVIRCSGRNNVNLLRDVLHDPDYTTGNITTKFLEEKYPNGYSGHELSELDSKELACVAAMMHVKATDVEDDAAEDQLLRYVVQIGDAHYLAEVGDESGVYCTKLESEPATETSFSYAKLPMTFPSDAALLDAAVSLQQTEETGKTTEWQTAQRAAHDAASFVNMHIEWSPEEHVCSFTSEHHDRQSVQVISKRDMDYTLQHLGTQYVVSVRSPQQARAMQYMRPPPVVDAATVVLSPMPGVVVGVDVEVGQRVTAGQVVMTLEAMKMRNSLSVTATGTIVSINAGVDSKVEEGAVLIDVLPDAVEDKA